jgi:acetyl esterase/lipase
VASLLLFRSDCPQGPELYPAQKPCTFKCMPLIPVLRLAVLGFVCATMVGATELPAQRAVPILPMNSDLKGPPVPAQDPVESAHPPSIPLWPAGAPGSEARKAEPENISWRQEPDIVFPVIFNIHNPSITPFLPAPGTATGTAVIIAPGGGHWQLTIDREGYDLGRWLAERGIAAFVLKYRLARDAAGKSPYKIEVDALADAHRAIRLIRSHAKEWNVNSARVGILGFSAGGEVALLAATHHDSGKAEAIDPVERQSSRPDFFAPIYPGGLQRTDYKISKESTPPAFLACAFDDRMPEQLAAFFTTLRQAGVNAEIHIYNSGGHGFGVRNDRPTLAVSGWQTRFTEWLGDLGMLRK